MLSDSSSLWLHSDPIMVELGQGSVVVTHPRAISGHSNRLRCRLGVSVQFYRQ